MEKEDSRFYYNSLLKILTQVLLKTFSYVKLKNLQHLNFLLFLFFSKILF